MYKQTATAGLYGEGQKGRDRETERLVTNRVVVKSNTGESINVFAKNK